MFANSKRIGSPTINDVDGHLLELKEDLLRRHLIATGRHNIPLMMAIQTLGHIFDLLEERWQKQLNKLEESPWLGSLPISPKIERFFESKIFKLRKMAFTLIPEIDTIALSPNPPKTSSARYPSEDEAEAF